MEILNAETLIHDGEGFRDIDKNQNREEYVAWATKVALYLEQKYPNTSIAEKSAWITKNLFMAYKVETNYKDLIGILKGARQYES